MSTYRSSSASKSPGKLGDGVPTETLKKWSKRFHGTQQAAADYLKVSRQTFQDWINNGVIPSESKHRKQIQDWIFTKIGAKTTTSEIVDLWQKLCVEVWDWAKLSGEDIAEYRGSQRPSQGRVAGSNEPAPSGSAQRFNWPSERTKALLAASNEAMLVGIDDGLVVHLHPVLDEPGPNAGWGPGSIDVHHEKTLIDDALPHELIEIRAELMRRNPQRKDSAGYCVTNWHIDSRSTERLVLSTKTVRYNTVFAVNERLLQENARPGIGMLRARHFQTIDDFDNPPRPNALAHHVLVITGDGMLLLVQRPKRTVTDCYPEAWSASYQQGLNAPWQGLIREEEMHHDGRQLDDGDDPVFKGLRRSLAEELSLSDEQIAQVTNMRVVATAYTTEVFSTALLSIVQLPKQLTFSSLLPSLTGKLEALRVNACPFDYETLETVLKRGGVPARDKLARGLADKTVDEWKWHPTSRLLIYLALCRSLGRRNIDRALESAIDNDEQDQHADSKSQHTDFEIPAVLRELGVIQVFQPPLQINDVSAVVHREADIDLDPQTQRAFVRLNEQRKARGLSAFYSAPRYRVIRPPYTSADGQLVIDLGAADWAHAALLQTAGTPEAIKEAIRRQLRQTSRNLPDHLQSEDPVFNGQNMGMIAVQIAILTADGFTLLRKRGRQVHQFGNVWDVSFSGFCGSDALSRDSGEPHRLELQRTVERELLFEIGASWADARNLWFTGLFRDFATNNTVVMGYLEVPHKKEALIDYLTHEDVAVARPFPTTRKATEEFVSDYTNMVVEFDGSAISAALRKAQVTESGSAPDIAPVARATLLLALSCRGKSTKELER